MPGLNIWRLRWKRGFGNFRFSERMRVASVIRMFQRVSMSSIVNLGFGKNREYLLLGGKWAMAQGLGRKAERGPPSAFAAVPERMYRRGN